MPDADSPSPRNKALDLLARREHSVAELRAKLAARHFDPDQIDQAIDALIQQDLVSDDRFAESFVVARIRKGQGPVKIRAELTRRGLAEELIDRHVGHADIDWYRLARTVRDRKFGPSGAVEWRDKARQGRFLQQRGFSGEQIRAVLAFDDADDDAAVF